MAAPEGGLVAPNNTTENKTSEFELKTCPMNKFMEHVINHCDFLEEYRYDVDEVYQVITSTISLLYVL